MLKTLRIRNLAIVDDLTIEFGPGLNVLTGETGAGKSILVGALGLLGGRRADASMLRAGSERAIVEALFEIGDVHELLEEAGIDVDGGELVVRRDVAPAGQGRVRLNGSPGTVGLLKEAAGRLIELHGQHEQHGLLTPSRHLELLDRFAAHPELLGQVAEHHTLWQEARGRLAVFNARAEDREREVARLSAVVEEIRRVDPRPGELAELDRQRARLQHAAELERLIEESRGLLWEGETTASSLTAAAARRVARLAEIDPTLAEAAERLESARLELEDLGDVIARYRDEQPAAGGRLEQIESRRAELERLLLHHGPDEAAALAEGERAAAALVELERFDETRELMAAEVDSAVETWKRLAARLTTSRRAAAKRLLPAVHEQLRELALGGARVAVEWTAGSAGVPDPLGAERAEFTLAANPGEAARGLHRVASGGELSRLMLALHLVLDGGVGRSVVFDEVDAGVGGATAAAVGARLARLSQERQVLCVTHLPQVAAWAAHHYHVSKQVDGGRTRATVDALEEEARVEELARMLGGAEVTEASRAHATELMEMAR